jgi:hypothetical protein
MLRTRHTPGSRARRALALVGLGALAVSFTACQVTPDKDTFYTAPSPGPGVPGSIIRSRPSVFTMDPITNSPVAGVTSWQVVYRSENAANAAIAVSGTVLVPTAAWTGPGARPLISWGVGTRGLGDQCAPSYTLSTGGDYEATVINDALKKGWAVAVSDMEGLGTPGMHTYEVGRSQGKAMLNMARAAERLPGTGLSASTPLGLWGYSQGGTTAGWAAELAPTYAPELNLKGVAAGGVPADLNAVAQFLDGGPAVAFALLAAVGYDAAYPELKLGGYLNAEGKKWLASSQSLCLASIDGVGALGGTAFHHLSDYTTTNPLPTPAWQARLSENKLGSGKPTVPVFQYHAQLDEIVAYDQADALHKAWCAKGVKLTWKPLLIAEHASGMVEGEGDALTFLADRFAGKAATTNC